MFHAPKPPSKAVRVTAGLVIPRGRTFLLVQGFDRTTPGVYWRPPGGDAVFGTYAHESVAEAAAEQLGAGVADVRYFATLESLYRMEGKKRHEVMLLFAGRFADARDYERAEWVIRDEAGDVSKGVWMDLDAPPADVLFNPAGLRETVLQHWGRITEADTGQ